MASDRFVTFKPKNTPSREDLEFTLSDYLLGIGVVEWEKDRFFVTLPGQVTSPFRRIPEAHPRTKMEDPRVRSIEVIPSKNKVDVLTRSMDEVTCVLADGYAALLARFWEGTLEE